MADATDALSWTERTFATVPGVGPDAAALLGDAHFIDLHLDLHVPVRLFGYDPARAHRPWCRPIPFFGHTDLPRVRQSGFTGVVYDVATNPFRPESSRLEATHRNLRDVVALAESHPDHLAIATTAAAYDRAVAAGKLAMMPSLQGGNAVAASVDALDGPLGDLVTRITVVHLTTSVFGGTSSPLGADTGLTARGAELVQRMVQRRILVDLAHAGKKTFWGLIEQVPAGTPPIVSHTGVAGVHPHWRNVDDAQIRAIADRGGVVGVMYQSSFLEPVLLWGRRARILDHLQHIIDVAGEDVPAIGTDYDGMIVPPGDLADVTHHGLLVQDMLDRGWSEARIRKILGLNYLRVFREVRP